MKREKWISKGGSRRDTAGHPGMLPKKDLMFRAKNTLWYPEQPASLLRVRSRIPSVLKCVKMHHQGQDHTEEKAAAVFVSPHGCISCHKTTHRGCELLFLEEVAQWRLNSQFESALLCLCVWPSLGARFAKGPQVFLDRKVISGFHGLAVMSRVFPHPPGAGQV